MLASPQPSSLPFDQATSAGGIRQLTRPMVNRDAAPGGGTDKQPLWIPMLQSASKGKDLSEKQLIVLGGTSDLQREFLEQLNPEATSRQNLRTHDRRRQKQNAPISNKFALGYTYHDVLDADHEDVLARLNVYMLANPSGQMGSLLQPLITSKTVKDTLITILLDWSDPFKWARQLRQWIRLLRKVILSLDEETKIAMEENMNAWKEKRVGPDAQSSVQQDIVVTQGPGEWDEGLGVPVSIVCVQVEKIERLERELGWGDDQFDYLQQWLRTILLKHGGSLVYTASFEPNNVRTLIHTSLNIQSLLKRDVAKHNVIDRDKILVPPNWDSWGKIRILREGYDPEIVSNAWSVEIQDQAEDSFDPTIPKKQETEAEILASANLTDAPISSAVLHFEQSLPNLVEDTTANQSTSTTEITITPTPFQDFLQAQTAILANLRTNEENETQDKTQRVAKLGNAPSDNADNSNAPSGTMSPVKGAQPASSFLTESIGSHRVNVNGIDFDAEEATRRLRERENERNALRRGVSETLAPGAASNGAPAASSGTASPAKSAAGRGTGAGAAFGAGGGDLTPGVGDGKPSNEALHGFFANLIKKGEQGRNRAVGSGTASPRRESPAPPSRTREESG